MESETSFSNELIDQEEKVSFDEIKSQFENPIEIDDISKIKDVFQELKDEHKITISIPVSICGNEDRSSNLKRISRELRLEIFSYIGLSPESEIGEDIKTFVGEAISDIGKHAFPNEKFEKILVSVSKNGNDLAFHLVNPAKSDVNLNIIEDIDGEDELDKYDKQAHGQNIALAIESDLNEKGCIVADKSRIVEDADTNIGVSRDIKITVPDSELESKE
ncbi:MAG: hypothetical protein WCV58_03835 [Patescibacteria group bacterium]